MRQTWVSTGNSSLARQNIITHATVFAPTPLNLRTARKLCNVFAHVRRKLSEQRGLCEKRHPCQAPAVQHRQCQHIQECYLQRCCCLNTLSHIQHNTPRHRWIS